MYRSTSSLLSLHFLLLNTILLSDTCRSCHLPPSPFPDCRDIQSLSSLLFALLKRSTFYMGLFTNRERVRWCMVSARKVVGIFIFISIIGF